MERGLAKLFKDRFPEISEVEAGKGETTYITYTTKIPIIDEEERKSEKYIYKLSLGGKEEGTAEMLYAALKRLKEATEKHRRKKVALPMPEGLTVEKIRKIAESTFNKTEVNIEIYTPRKRQGKPTYATITRRDGTTHADQPKEQWTRVVRKQTMERKATRERRRDKKTEAVFIKAEGKSYAELLKMVRNGVDIEAIRAQVTSMRKSKNGELLVEIKDGSGMIEPLKEEITNKIEGVSIRTTSTEKIILIRDIDAVTKAEEVKRAIKDCLNLESGLIQVNSLRAAYGENQVATVALPKEAAQKLMGIGKLRIGWISCRVRERVNAKRCDRC